MESIPLDQLQADLPRFMDEVASTRARYRITRDGETVAVLLAAEDLDTLEETLEVLTDTESVTAIHEGLAEADAGRVFTHDEVATAVRARGRGPQGDGTPAGRMGACGS